MSLEARNTNITGAVENSYRIGLKPHGAHREGMATVLAERDQYVSGAQCLWQRYTSGGFFKDIGSQQGEIYPQNGAVQYPAVLTIYLVTKNMLTANTWHFPVSRTEL